MFQRVFSSLLLLTLLASLAQADFPGPVKGGYRLGNGWTITPVGKHLPAKDTVLNLAISPDGKFMAALSCGYNQHAVLLIDTVTQEPVQELPLATAWLGLAWAADGATLFVSGGNRKGEKGNTAPVYAIPFYEGRLDGSQAREFRDGLSITKSAWAGIALHPTRPILYAANRFADRVTAFDTGTGQVLSQIPVEKQPYALTISTDGNELYVTNWASDTLSVVDTVAAKTVANIPAGDNPNDLKLLPDGRLFVCSSNDNSVRSFDTKSRQFTERILTSLYPKAPEGSTPNALGYDPATHRLYVANADNYNVCVINVEDPGECSVLGFIPAGYYPSALALANNGSHLYIGNAMGIAGWATPLGPRRPSAPNEKGENIKKAMVGDVSIVDLTSEKLEDWTEQCTKNCPYSDKLLTEAEDTDEASVVPREVGAGSPIKHVLYIIKENRTYDQVLGDIRRGNGDKSLCIFGEDITPNTHALAREFVQLDNLYCDAEVSADGHMWSNAAYATDATEKTWPAGYGGKSEAGRSAAMRPASGFLWDQAAAKNLTYRSYGEFALRQSDGGGMKPVPEVSGALEGNVAPNYLGWGARDTENAAEFIREFDEYEKHFDDPDPGKRLPNLMVMCLPEDHTKGTKPDAHTPRACVASNDLALGQIVERISHSKYWPEIAIFVIEDDAQDGSDHVDARRTVGQCISPYTRRGKLDSTLYSTSSMLRTMELLLGLSPMSQFDAAATPMFAALGTTRDLTPYMHRPATFDINEMNAPDAPGAKASANMDFSAPDRTPMFALNEVVWHSVKGAKSPMPLPLHRYTPGAPVDID